MQQDYSEKRKEKKRKQKFEMKHCSTMDPRKPEATSVRYVTNLANSDGMHFTDFTDFTIS